MAWLSGYAKRKSITVTGTLAGAQTDYAIELELSRKTGASSGKRVYLDGDVVDFNDIRFTEDDGETLIPHWRECVNEFGMSFHRWKSNPFALPLHGGSGRVHPSALYFDAAVDGYKYWMVYTPYPTDAYEQPCIVRSNDGVTWVETGITNPVITRGTSGQWDEYHCPDPDIIYVADYSKWFMVYAGSQPGAGKMGALFHDTTVGLAYSTDGKTWTKCGVLVDGTDTNEKFSDTNERNCVQPALIYESGTFHLWYVTYANGTAALGENRGKLLKGTFTWNDTSHLPENFTRDGGNPILYPSADADFESGLGHVHVSKHNGTYYLYAVRCVLSTSTLELDLWTSTSKVTWTRSGKAMARQTQWPSEATHLYHGGPLTDPDKSIIASDDTFNFYYSSYGANPSIGLAKAKVPVGIFWVKLDSIGASPSTKDIYIYYGKSSDSSASSMEDTFVRYDDGVAGNLDTDLEGSGALSHTGGKYQGASAATSDAWAAGYPLPTWNYELRLREFGIPTGDAGQVMFGFFNAASVSALCRSASDYTNLLRFYFVRALGGSDYILYLNGGDTIYYYTGSAWQTGASGFGFPYLKPCVKVWSDGTDLFCDVLNEAQGESLLSTVASIPLSSVKSFAAGQNGAWIEPYTDAYNLTHQIDDYFVRKYVDPEPTIDDVGDPESESTGASQTTDGGFIIGGSAEVFAENLVPIEVNVIGSGGFIIGGSAEVYSLKQYSDELSGGLWLPSPIISGILLGDAWIGDIDIPLFQITGTMLVGKSWASSMEIPLPRMSGRLNQTDWTGEMVPTAPHILGNMLVGMSLGGELLFPVPRIQGRLIFVPDLSGAIVLPIPVMVGTLLIGRNAPAYKAVAMNVSSGAVTEYTRFPANSFAYLNGKYLAASEEGLFLLEGGRDDGRQIDSEVMFPPADMETAKPRYAWVTCRSDGELTLLVEIDEKDTWEKGFSYIYPDQLHEVRETIAKGLRGRFFSFGIKNVDGADFDIDSLRILLDQTARPR